jgi:acetylornithine deacetylase
VIPDSAQAIVQLRLASDAAAIQHLLEEIIGDRGSLNIRRFHDPVHLLTVDRLRTMLARFTTDIPYLSNWGKAFVNWARIDPRLRTPAGERVAKT